MDNLKKMVHVVHTIVKEIPLTIEFYCLDRFSYCKWLSVVVSGKNKNIGECP
jgi:hypothetical protein